MNFFLRLGAAAPAARLLQPASYLAARRSGSCRPAQEGLLQPANVAPSNDATVEVCLTTSGPATPPPQRLLPLAAPAARPDQRLLQPSSAWRGGGSHRLDLAARCSGSCHTAVSPAAKRNGFYLTAQRFTPATMPPRSSVSGHPQQRLLPPGAAAS